MTWQHPNGAVPDCVALVGLGPSKQEFFDMQVAHDFAPPWQEVWTVNAGVRLLPSCDLLWVMDDIEEHSRIWPEYGASLAAHAGPVITGRAYSCGPARQFEYPLQAIVDHYGDGCASWLHTISIPYILAYAGWIGVQRIVLFGIDCHWPGMPELTERGQAVVCYWLGRLAGLGVLAQIASTSALADVRRIRDYDWRRFYGYLRQPILERK